MPLNRKRTNVYSEGQTTTSHANKRQQIKTLQNESYEGKTEFEGVILRVEDIVQASLGYRVATLGYSSKSYAVRVRVPELHDGTLPAIPHKSNASRRNQDGIIDLHPVFEGTSTRVPSVGDAIRVSFLDRHNSSIRNGNGRILEIIPAATKGLQGDRFGDNIKGKSASQAFVPCEITPAPVLSYTDKLIQAIEKYESKSVINPKKTPSAYRVENNSTRNISEQPASSSQVPSQGQTSSNRPEGNTASGSPIQVEKCGIISTVGTSSPPPQAPIVQASSNTILPLDPIANIPCKRVSSEFGMRIHPLTKKRKGHKGVDYASGASRTNRSAQCNINFKPCYSSLDGVVVAATIQGTGIDASKVTRSTPGARQDPKKMAANGAGKYVKIKHGQYGELYTLYMHLASFTVKKGQKVKRGDQIGLMDNTGGSSGPHLHYEVRKGSGSGRSAIDPMIFLKTPLPAK